MNVRRKLALAVAAAAVAVPALSACSLSGFDYATDRPNSIANGGYYIEGPIHVLAARIIAPSDGSGAFVATIATDASSQTVAFDGLEGVTAEKFAPVELKPNAVANLYNDGAIAVTGDFKAGQSVPVTLSFDDGTRIRVNAIVVTQCHEYADPSLAPSAGKRAGAASPSATATESSSAAATHEATDHSTEEAAAAAEGDYSCEYASVPPLAESEH